MTTNDPVLYEFRLSDLLAISRDLLEIWFDDEHKIEKAGDFLDWIKENYNAHSWAFANDVRIALDEVAFPDPEFWDSATTTLYELISYHLEEDVEEDEEDE